MIVQRGHEDVHVRVILLHFLHALGGADDAHELDVLYARLLEEGDRRGGRTAGGQHRVDHDGVALLDIGGHLEVVLDRLQRLRVAEQAHMAHLDVGHHADHAVHHAETGAEDGNHSQLLAGDSLALGHGNGRFHFHFLQRQIAGRLIAHQHGDLGDELTKFLDAGPLVAQDGQLVLDQGMVEYAYFAHDCFSFI